MYCDPGRTGGLYLDTMRCTLLVLRPICERFPTAAGAIERSITAARASRL
jgi:hypothetical protein